MKKDEFGNITRKEDYKQVVMWPSTTMGDGTAEEFEKFILDNLGVRVQFLEEIETTPDMKNGKPVPDTGGRHDLIFAVHDEDIAIFAIPRFQFGMRWIEDVLDNEKLHTESKFTIYPERITHYRTW